MGLKEHLANEGMIGYLAVINNGDVICEKKSNPGKQAEFYGDIDNHSVYMLSMPFNGGNVCDIKFDGIDYSNNMRGLNIIVVDIKKSTIIDRVSFDTHCKEYTCIHLKKHYDIALFGWWYNKNYGAILTYFALHQTLISMGYSVLMLFRSVKNFDLPINVPITFARSHYDISPRVEEKDLYKYNDYCDTFLLGSDQLWNPDLEGISGKQFFFDFVDSKSRKVAYAQSFGNYTELPTDYINKYKKYIQDFNAVSVREEYAVDLCHKSLGIEVAKVCDPIFLVDSYEFVRLTDSSNIELPKEYLLGFLLDPNDEKINFCKRVATEKQFKNIIFFTDLDQAGEKAKQFGNELVYPDASIEDFIKAYLCAGYVITDSFHGTCLSLIFKKQFFSLANLGRGVGRVESLLSNLNLKDRIIYDYDRLDSLPIHDLNHTIDYDKVNQILDCEKKHSLQWLKQSINVQEDLKIKQVLGCKKKVDESINMKDCTGCGACYNVCPFGAISMKPNHDGFLYPVIDSEKCISCGKCSEVCPKINSNISNRQHPLCYAVASDDSSRFTSSSGGVFFVLAKWILDSGGIVCGAAYDKDFGVYHKCIDSEDELSCLQKSKYVQSDIKFAYKSIKNFASDGRQILFVGTPCQVAALRNVLGELCEKVILVDFLCGGVPSPKMWSDYLHEQFDVDQIEKIDFRPKEKGWSSFYLSLTFKDHTKKILHFDDSEYEQGYHKYLTKRECCTVCEFCGTKRQGDLTIGDFWGIEGYDENLNDHKGLSVLLSNNIKGDNVISKITDKFVVFNKTPLEAARHNSLYIVRNAHQNKSKFSGLYSKVGFSVAVRQCMASMDRDNEIDELKKTNLALAGELDRLNRRLTKLESPFFSNIKMWGYIIDRDFSFEEKKWAIQKHCILNLGYYPDLDNPKSLNEKTNWYKLHYRDPLITKCIDKYLFKQYVIDTVGEQYVVPLLGVYDKAEEISIDSLPMNFVLKSNWGSGSRHVMVIKNHKMPENWQYKLNSWILPWENVYYHTFDWGYRDITPKILAETYLENKGLEYDFFCFYGEPRFLYVSNNSEPGEIQYRNFYDIDWNYLPIKRLAPNFSSKLDKPLEFEEMLTLCRKLSKPFPHVRVDLMVLNQKIYVGELTFYTGSGEWGYNPVEWDYKLGEYFDLPNNNLVDL